METQPEAGEILLLDKPYRWTSFDVVKKIRNKLKVKKVGHAGTLDPLATGLLIICTGKMTKQIDLYQAKEKEYTGSMILGETRPSVDMETDVDAKNDISGITTEEILDTTKYFQGEIQQIPPAYSAIKIDGDRVYKKARKGELVEMKPRSVQIDEFELTNIELPRVDFRVVCSKGTYIRSLVRDFGDKLGVGAYLSNLRRTRIGEFHVSNAINIEQFNVKEFDK